MLLLEFESVCFAYNKSKDVNKNCQYTGKLVIFSQLWSCGLEKKKKSSMFDTETRQRPKSCLKTGLEYYNTS